MSRPPVCEYEPREGENGCGRDAIMFFVVRAARCSLLRTLRQEYDYRGKGHEALFGFCSIHAATEAEALRSLGFLVREAVRPR